MVCSSVVHVITPLSQVETTDLEPLSDLPRDPQTATAGLGLSRSYS